MQQKLWLVKSNATLVEEQFEFLIIAPDKARARLRAVVWRLRRNHKQYTKTIVTPATGEDMDRLLGNCLNNYIIEPAMYPS